MGRGCAAERGHLRPMNAANAQRSGTCELCGGHGRDLRILTLPDCICWACEECRRQLMGCTLRRFCGTVEETEPGE